MAEMKVPIKIDGFKCIDDIVKAVLNYTYKGKTLKEWADSISKPQTNADDLRSMTDKELAEFIAYSTSCDTCVVRKGGSDECHNTNCSTAWHDWLKQEVDNE